MNVTHDHIGQPFTTGEKVATPLVFLPCLFLSFLLYRYSRRRLSGKDTFNKRMIPLYSAISGALLGQFFFHTLPNSLAPGVITTKGISLSIFVFVGFFVMLVVQKCSRVSNENTYYTAPESTTMDIEHSMNREDMVLNEYFEAPLGELSKPLDNGQTQFALDSWTVIDESKELRRRRIIVVVILVMMTYIAILEGLFLVYDQRYIPGVLIVSHYVNKMIQTFTVSVSLIHGMFHMHQKKRQYSIMILIWCCCCGFSGLPAVLNMPLEQAQYVLTHPMINITYSVAAGIMFWMSLYFIWIDKKHTTKKDIAGRLFLFALFAVASYITGIFL